MARFAFSGASSVFIFLTILLITSRIPLPETIFPTLYLIFSVLASTVILYFHSGYKGAYTALISLAGFFLVLLIWAFATRSFYDAGHDSYAYHLRAVWDLTNGWHPFFSTHNNIWVNSYPSGYWALQSYLVSITGLLLSGHSMIVGLMAAVFLLAYALFLEKMSPLLPRFSHLTALLFAGIIAANPIVLTQLMTHYVDAPLYLIGSSLTFFLMQDALNTNRLARWGAICCIILLINTKTAALYYTPLIVFGGFIMDLVLRKGDPDFFKRAFLWVKSRGILYGLVALFAVIVIGYKPYVTNVTEHGQLLYPSVDKIMAPNTPRNVEPLPVPMKFLYGIFSITADNHWPRAIDAPIVLKIPGTFEKSEFLELIFDTRRGGFGPMFSLAFLASIFAFAAAKFAARASAAYSWKREGDGVAAFAVVLTVVSMFFPESWWARYVPLTWLAAILFGLSSLYVSGKGKALIAIHLLQLVALASFLLCILAATIGAARQNLYTYRTTQEIDYMKTVPKVELSIWEGGKVIQSSSLSIWEELLKRRGVQTRIIPDSQDPICKEPGYLVGGVHWCVLTNE